MGSTGRETFGFEGYTLDLTRGSLRKGDREIGLRPKSFALLRYFVENPGRLVSKDELINALWPNVIVSDESLSQCISDVRHAVDDQHRHGRRIIKTVHGRGYLFDSPVSRPVDGDVMNDDDIFGDGVSVAARLESMGVPGGICVSARVDEDAAGRIEAEFEHTGEQELKNIGRSVRQIAGEKHVTSQNNTETAPSRSAAIAPGLRQIGYVGVVHRPVVEEFRRGLAAYGHVDSRTIQIHYRWSEGDYSRYPDLLRELMKIPVELIVADATPAVAAAKRATTCTPIVMVGVGDPVAYGIVPSLMRPGGNITGMSNAVHEDLPRGLRLFKEILPEATRVAILTPEASNHPGVGPGVTWVEDAAHLLGMIPRVYSASTADELRATIAFMDRRTDVLIVIPDHRFAMNRSVILGGASTLKIPVLCPLPEYAREGALMSLGPNRTELYRRVAYFVDAILKGAQPSDLPVEEASKHWLVINLKTAAALGISIPGPILMRADELIE